MAQSSARPFRPARATSGCSPPWYHAFPIVLPVDVAILVSQDGDRLYVESMTTSADAPTAQHWARSFLRLLSCAGNQPDVPLAAHALTVG